MVDWFSAVDDLFAFCTREPAVTSLLEKTIASHGRGLVLSILEGVLQAHVIKVEHAKHGIFVKCILPRRRDVHVPSDCDWSSYGLANVPLASRTRFLPPHPHVVPPPPPLPPCRITAGINEQRRVSNVADPLFLGPLAR